MHKLKYLVKFEYPPPREPYSFSAIRKYFGANRLVSAMLYGQITSEKVIFLEYNVSGSWLLSTALPLMVDRLT